MSTITEQRTICDMDHGEETRPSMDACLRCGKDICPAHCCDLIVPDTNPDRWPSERIATFCRPCADELVRVAQWDADSGHYFKSKPCPMRWGETNHAGEPVPPLQEALS